MIWHFNTSFLVSGKRSRQKTNKKKNKKKKNKKTALVTI